MKKYFAALFLTSLLLAQLGLTGCVTVFDSLEVEKCLAACDGFIQEVGKNKITGTICCRCYDGRIYKGDDVEYRWSEYIERRML